jgi:putative ABC transport system permease protein
MLVATTAFTVLAAAARTAQIRTIGTVNAHFQSAYDILVRPSGARSRLESATGTVQPDFLSGIYGGITMAQWNQISRIAGVQVAAPIAMVGYTFMNAQFPVRLPAADVARPGRQLYRINTPHLLLADEPTGNLDSQAAAGILDLLTRLRRESEMTVIIATHDPQIASRCDRLIRLRDGAVIDDIEISGGYPVDETIRRVGQLG